MARRLPSGGALLRLGEGVVARVGVCALIGLLRVAAKSARSLALLVAVVMRA